MDPHRITDDAPPLTLDDAYDLWELEEEWLAADFGEEHVVRSKSR